MDSDDLFTSFRVGGKRVKGYHSSFSCCCDKCPRKINFRNEGFVLTCSSRVESFMVGEVLVAGGQGRSRKGVFSRCSPSPLLSLQSGAQAYGMVPPTVP